MPVIMIGRDSMSCLPECVRPWTQLLAGGFQMIPGRACLTRPRLRLLSLNFKFKPQ